MDLWGDDNTRNAWRRRDVGQLLESAKMRLTPQDHAMTPDDVLFLLSHITSFADAMSDTCENAKQVAMLKPN
jgi:hypothetical protein